MSPLILCLERLERIERVLDRMGGLATVRELVRSHGIYYWELEQAEEQGWIAVTKLKPSVGRPSYVAMFCGYSNAKSLPDKSPPARWQIEPEISWRHELFAMRSVFQGVKGGMPGWGIPPLVHVYMKLYRCRSKNGAYVSVSRLLNRRDIQAARQWYFAKLGNEIPEDLPMPRTPRAIWAKLEEHGSRRAQSGWNPYRK